jgi:hypothetical protein
VFAILLCAVCAASGARGAVVIVPGGSTVAGKSIGEWTADWWNWSTAGPGNVFADADGSVATQNQTAPVFFVAGTQGGAPVTRSFEIPAGKFVLFPLINIIVANGPDPGFASTQEEANAFGDTGIDPAKLFANLDGVDAADLASHREKSPVNFTWTVQPGTGQFTPGTFTDANSDGYWLMLEPLDAGAHTLIFGGQSNDFGDNGNGGPLLASFIVAVTDNVTVPGSTAIPLPAGALAAMPLLTGLAATKAWRARRRSR